MSVIPPEIVPMEVTMPELIIENLKQRDNDLQKAIDSVSMKLDLILVQITKVAVLEEKHTSQAADINRAHAYIADLKRRHEADDKELRELVATLSRDTLAYINQSKGQNRVIWTLITTFGSALLTMLVKILFFMGANGAG